jgi:hypothetical protein
MITAWLKVEGALFLKNVSVAEFSNVSAVLIILSADR